MNLKGGNSQEDLSILGNLNILGILNTQDIQDNHKSADHIKIFLEDQSKKINHRHIKPLKLNSLS